MLNIEEEVRALRSEVDGLKQRNQLPKLMTSKDCAEFLQCSESALRLWRKDRERGGRRGPPFLHLSSGKVMYDRDDVLEWARNRRV